MGEQKQEKRQVITIKTMVELQRDGWQSILNHFKRYTEGLAADASV